LRIEAALDLQQFTVAGIDAVELIGSQDLVLGKIHLAKDQVLTPEQFYRVFPRYRDLLAIKRRLDPDGLFTSDLARRVGIDPVLNKQLPEMSSSKNPPLVA